MKKLIVLIFLMLLFASVKCDWDKEEMISNLTTPDYPEYDKSKFDESRFAE